MPLLASQLLINVVMSEVTMALVVDAVMSEPIAERVVDALTE